MLTYQDYLAAADLPEFVAKVIARHKQSEVYNMAVIADAYDRQRNTTIREFSDMLGRAAHSGVAAAQISLAIASNYFRRFNTQRCSYLLGNGVSFTRMERRRNDAGILVNVDVTKELLGQDYDSQLYQWAYHALIHGVAFGYWDSERLYVFPVTQFAPLPDEDTGALMAGVRFWRIDEEHPMKAELYTAEGIFEFEGQSRGSEKLVAAGEGPRAYIERTRTSAARGTVAVGAVAPKGFPVIPMYGSNLRQSTLVGLREKIDAWDLIASGLAKDLKDVAAIYWIMNNANGMDQAELNRLLDDMLTHHIINVDGSGFDGSVREAMSPYSTEVPHQGRLSFLEALEKSMYRDFGAMDVRDLTAGATNDHIDAAYQPLDEEADQLELQVIEAVRMQLKLMDIDDTPRFDRSKAKNITELTNAVMASAQFLDAEAVLDHLPFITVDEKDAILQRMDAEDAGRLMKRTTAASTGETTDEA